MNHCVRIGSLALLSFMVLSAAKTVCGEGESLDRSHPTLADPLDLQDLAFAPSLVAEGIQLRGPYSRRQLLVNGSTTVGRQVDATRSVTYAVEPGGVAAVDATGLVTPLRDGHATIVADGGNGLRAEMDLVVAGIHDHAPVDFQNQIVPIFFKAGCSSGGCHGKASGQNGFRLSLMGFYPDDDYEFLTREGRGRRLFPGSPEKSLLLSKALGQSHRGGKRLEETSLEYQLIRDWIAQSMPLGNARSRKLVEIKCVPDHRLMIPNSTQQITALAYYDDGSIEDITRVAVYESNDAGMADVDDHGLVTTLHATGEAAIMAVFQGQVATYRATIPLGADTGHMPPPRNYVDEAVFQKLRLLGIPPSQKSDDATFLRRVHLDITGRIPTESETSAFLLDQDSEKRDRLIDRLLDSSEYADYFTNKWNMILRNKRRSDEDLPGVYAFQRWLWSNLYENKPYDRMVRELVTASGDVRFNPAVVWYREVDERSEQVEDVAQLFLGTRIQCAKCHHHPYEKWGEDDYYAFAAFFSRLGTKDLRGASRQNRDRRLFHKEGIASSRNPRTGANLKPAGLGEQSLSIPADHDPRIELAAWMLDPDNPFFAKALVNRYWKHFFNRGIVEPEDDLRATNPPSNPELLRLLSENFVESGYDLKALVRTICQSETYQLSSIPNEYNANDKQNYSRYYSKRLTAESLHDALHQVTGTNAEYAGVPVGTRAIQLADVTTAPYFLSVFGQPLADTACECERSQQANLAQSLHLINSEEIQHILSSDKGRTAEMAGAMSVTHDQRIRELYRWAYSREPSNAELNIALDYVEQRSSDSRGAYEDLVWALVNSKEFLFNH